MFLLLLIVGLLAYIGYRVELLQTPQIEVQRQINMLNNTINILEMKLLNETKSESILQTKTFDAITAIL